MEFAGIDVKVNDFVVFFSDKYKRKIVGKIIDDKVSSLKRINPHYSLTRFIHSQFILFQITLHVMPLYKLNLCL